MNESMTPANDILDGRYAVEELVYEKNGHHHLYLRNLETDKLKPTSWEAVADAYGHEVGQPNLNGSVDIHAADQVGNHIEKTSSEGITDEQRLIDHAKWQLSVGTADKKPSERGLTADDIIYNSWLKENATETNGQTLRQKMAEDAKVEVEKTRLDSLREFARLKMRVNTGVASGEEAAYYYTLIENSDESAGTQPASPAGVAEDALKPNNTDEGQDIVDSVKTPGEVIRDAQDRLLDAEARFRRAGDNDAVERKKAIGEAIAASRDLSVLQNWDEARLNLENKRFQTKFGTWLVQPTGAPVGKGDHSQPAADVQAQSQEQAELEEAQYHAELADLRAAMIAAAKSGDKEEIESLKRRMYGLITDRAQETGGDKDWIKQELMEEIELVREEQELANATRFKRAVMAFRKWRNNPENKTNEHRAVVAAAVGAITLVALFAGHSSSDHPKVSLVPAAASTTPAPAPAAAPHPGTPAGSETIQKLTAKDWTVSHVALENLLTRGIHSPSPAQIHSETQRLLDLNGLSWGQARHLALGTSIKV